MVPPVADEEAGRAPEPGQRVGQIAPETRIDDRRRPLEQLGREQLAALVDDPVGELVGAHLQHLDAAYPGIDVGHGLGLALAHLARLGRLRRGIVGRFRTELVQPVACLGKPRLDFEERGGKRIADRVELAFEVDQLVARQPALECRFDLVERRLGLFGGIARLGRHLGRRLGQKRAGDEDDREGGKQGRREDPAKA